MSQNEPKVLLVGHCGADSWSLGSLVETTLPGARVVRVNDDSALQRELPGASLLLVNRVLDGRFAADGGIDLIRSLTQRADGPPMLLISNYADAQQAAEAAGAFPGFGKGELGTPKAAERVRAAAESARRRETA